jgi:hypothetical protein
MKLVIPDHPEQTTVFAETDGVQPAEVPPPVWPRIAELRKELGERATLFLARDREGILIGVVSSEEPESIDSVYLSDDGRVALGGLNHPSYFPSVTQMLTGAAAALGTEFIRIVFTTEDVLGLAVEAGIDETAAIARAEEWGKHIQDAAMQLCSEQLQAAVTTGQP